MLKLLMITGRGSAVDLASGKRGAFYNTLEEFHKYWERIDIIAPKVKKPIFNIFGNVFIHSSPWPLFLHPIFFIRKALEVYKKQKFDLITVHEFPPFYNGIAARLIWNKIKVPYVLEIFHIPGYPKAANLKERIYRGLFYLFISYDCREAKAVRVMNNQVVEKLTDLRIPQSKINLIPAIYFDLDIFKPMNLEKKYDFIFVGRLVKNKGLNLLLEAAKLLRFKFQVSGFKMLIVGDGSERKNLELRITNYGLKDNVILYGWVKDSQEVAQLLNQSKILILPSYNEGGPRVLLEAMACGVPVITTRVGIAEDLIKDGENGFFTDWSGESISEKASKLLENTELQRNFASSGLEIAKKFEKRAAIKNYAEKLQKLV